MTERKIHRLWLGPNPMPEPYVKYGKMFESMNPGWEVIEWTADNIPEVLNKSVWDEIGRTPKSSIPMEPRRATAVQRADVLGYELILRYGGMYFNADIEPLRPMDELLEVVGDRAWASHEDPHHIVNAAFGGPSDHDFWKMVVGGIEDSYMQNPEQPMEATTGPRYLTRIWRDYQVLWRKTFVALPIETFNYANFRQIEVGGDASAFREEARAAGAFGLHHWGHRQDQINYVEA